MPQSTAADDVGVESSKYALGVGGTPVDVGELPWGYGEDRVAAIVRDPDSAYLYWEITDEGIASARARLGPLGAQGWPNLRVYDTTGREFDGTNAKDYFDIRVDRTDREYFLMIRRPASSMHVEIGIKTSEGYFQPITRSGRADFPRDAPSPDTKLEWMTVTSGSVPATARPFRSRYTGPEPPLPAREGAGYVDVWRAAFAPSEAQAARQHTPWSGAHRTVERSAHIERWWHLGEWRAEWRAGLRFTISEASFQDWSGATWQRGPFPVGFFDAERLAIEWVDGLPALLRADGTEFRVYGPWRVVIRSFEREPERRVLGSWSIQWVIATTPMIERWGFTLERRRISGYEREDVTVGASERHAVLERGASEVWRLGASERLWLGASELSLGGASETLFVGASQLAFAGASALLFAGASERLGASELWRASVGAQQWVGGSAWSATSGTSIASAERWAFRPEEH